MKILVLTKNHPVEVIDIVGRIYNTVISGRDDTICLSPQATALMIEEQNGIPYTAGFYAAVNTFEKSKGIYANDFKHFITVGRVPIESQYWYDAVVALDNEALKDYTDIDEDYNVEGYHLMPIEKADIVFKHFDELRYFLIKILEGNYDIKSRTTRSD